LTLDADRWVAIVDDDESIRRALGRLLRAHGIEAQTFASARDYLDRSQGTPACLCVDLFLRDTMNGIELVEQLRARGITPPVVFITAQDERELEPMIRARHLGVVLRKPVDVTLLLDLMVEHARADFADGRA
jgi:FixJ family two-component response regulator